jgi:hypothetical protein
MMSEHKHTLFQVGGTADPIVPVCSGCGKDLMVLYMESEQRLAEARALLERIQANEPTWLDRSLTPYRCKLCGAFGEWRGEIPNTKTFHLRHGASCPIAWIRAFLAQ